MRKSVPEFVLSVKSCKLGLVAPVLRLDYHMWGVLAHEKQYQLATVSLHF